MSRHYHIGEIVYVVRFNTNKGHKGFVHPLYINSIDDVEIERCRCEEDFEDYAVFKDSNGDTLFHYYDRVSYGKHIDCMIFITENGEEYSEVEKYVRLVSKSNRKFRRHIKYSIIVDRLNEKKRIIRNQINVIRDITFKVCELDVDEIAA
jgi:hypothetical protein